uniref:Uncharacterized protein n=1 Tax=Noctiluca scintillans TaxID=2966 RepID=A0A7S1AP47_NOCSC
MDPSFSQRWPANMLGSMLSFASAVFDDRMTDDEIFLYDFVDVVRDLFLCHPNLLETTSHDKTHRRVLRCFVACRRFAEDPHERNYARVVSAWTDLAARSRHELRKVVRSSRTGMPSNTLLVLAGVKEAEVADVPRRAGGRPSGL